MKISVSAAGNRVAIADALRQALLGPALAAILHPEDLAGFGEAVNLPLIARIDRDAHHRRLGLDAVVEPLPALADILALVDRAVGAAEGRAQRGVQYLRVVWRGAQVAAITHRREPADIDILPMGAAVVAAEQAHPVGEEHRPRRRRAARQRMAVEHALDLGLADDPALVFLLLGKAQQVGRAILPAFAAVAALHRAVRLDAGIDIVRLRGIDVEPHDPARKAHVHPLRQFRIGQFLPMVAAIVAAVDAGRPVAGIDRARIVRVHRDRPDVGPLVGQRQPLPLVAAVLAAESALGGGDHHRIGRVGIDRDRMHLGIGRYAVIERVPALAAERLAEHPALAALRRLHRPDKHMVDRRHAVLPALRLEWPPGSYASRWAWEHLRESKAFGKLEADYAFAAV